MDNHTYTKIRDMMFWRYLCWTLIFIFGSCVLVFLLMSGFGRGRALPPGSGRDIAISILQYLDRSAYQVIHAEAWGARDPDVFIELHATPAVMNEMKSALLKTPEMFPETTLNDKDIIGQYVNTQKSKPRWWNPEKLPDADIVNISRPSHPSVVVFSKQTGRILIYRY